MEPPASLTTGNVLVPEKAAAFDTSLWVSRRPPATTVYYDQNSSRNEILASVSSHKKRTDPNQQQQYCSHFQISLSGDVGDINSFLSEEW